MLARSRRRWWVLPALIFLVSRAVDTVLLVVLSHEQADLLHDSRGMHVVEPKHASPGYLGVVTNWDGQWYDDIVRHGYPRHLTRDAGGHVDRNPWAFYPLYPALVRLVMVLGPSYAVAAGVVSVLCAGAGMLLLLRLVEDSGGAQTASLVVAGLAFYPAAPLFQAAYTEGLALMLIVGSLWLLRRERYLALAVVSVLLSLARPVSAPLVLVIAVHGALRWRRDRTARRWLVRWLVALAAAAGGVVVWPATCALVTGEWSAYAQTQRGWADDGWTTWLTSLVSHEDRSEALIVAAMIGLLLAVVLRLGARPWGTELRTWTLVYAAFLLATARLTPSIVRYAMLAIAPWWPLPPREPLSRPAWAVLLAGIAAIGTVTQYYWLSWFFVLGPSNIGYP